MTSPTVMCSLYSISNLAQISVSPLRSKRCENDNRTATYLEHTAEGYEFKIIAALTLQVKQKLTLVKMSNPVI